MPQYVIVIRRRSPTPTGQPGCQECFTVARVTLLIFAENGRGPALCDGDAEGVATAGGLAAEVAGAGGDAVAGPPPPQADESAMHSPVTTMPSVTRCIAEGLHGGSRASTMFVRDDWLPESRRQRTDHGGDRRQAPAAPRYA